MVDFQRLYIPVWDGGLYCYETRTGKLVWKNKASKIGKIVVDGDKIICDRDWGESKQTFLIANGNKV